MMGRRQRLKTGMEFDVVHKAPLCVLSKSGVKKSVKSDMNKRFRRERSNDLTTILLNLDM